MSKISILGVHSHRKDVLETLHKEEIVEICEPQATELSFRDTEKSIAQFDKYMLSAEAALAVLNEYAPEKTGFFAGRHALPIHKYHMAHADSDTTLKHIYHIIGLAGKIREHTESIRKIAAKQAALEPYAALDIPMNVSKTARTVIKSGALNRAWQEDELKKALEDGGLPMVHFEILSATKEHTYIWFIYPAAQKEDAGALLKGIGFVEPAFSLSHHTPGKKILVLEEAKAGLEQEIREFTAEIEQYEKYRRDIELFYDHLVLRKEKYRALAKTGMLEHVFVLQGYIPKRHGERLKSLLEGKYTVHVELTAPQEGEDVPVAFKNNAFVAPVEGITETYSMPSPSDVDPNPVMAFFYYLFFGMMFSDAGYGLLLAAVCGYLGFGKRLEKAKRKNYRMFFYCGVSTIFWGIMYGSFFGNIVYSISTTFFGKEISFDPLWLDPITQALTLLLFSVAFGMAHILVGLGLKFYSLWRQKKVADALLDVGLWIVSLLGICMLAGGAGLGIPLLGEIGKWVALAAALGLVATGGRKSKNIVGKVLGGITGLYGITGYVSDALSYCRLMALGLATGCIANVVNMLGGMFGGSVFGAILFIVIAIFGHALNFAMNALGAYVHTNRLQYVEFFSKFYDGGGRKFTPLKMDTKYCHFSED